MTYSDSIANNLNPIWRKQILMSAQWKQECSHISMSFATSVSTYDVHLHCRNICKNALFTTIVWKDTKQHEMLREFSYLFISMIYRHTDETLTFFMTVTEKIRTKSVFPLTLSCSALQHCFTSCSVARQFSQTKMFLWNYSPTLSQVFQNYPVITPGIYSLFCFRKSFFWCYYMDWRLLYSFLRT